MTPSGWKYGKLVCAAELSVEVCENRYLVDLSAPPLGVQHGRPWAPEPDIWILYSPLQPESANAKIKNPDGEWVKTKFMYIGVGKTRDW